MKRQFLFQAVPYAATAIFLAGLGIRYAQARSAAARNLLESGVANFGQWGALLCLGLFLQLLAHLAGLLFPERILLWNNVALQLYLLEGAGFVTGLLALAGWLGVLSSHLARPGEARKDRLSDQVFFTLLFVAILTGSLTAVIYRWGSSWSALTLTPYVRSLLQGKPTMLLAAELPFLVRLHVISSFLVILVFPLTRVARSLILALDRGSRTVLDPVTSGFEQVGRAFGSALQRPSAWIWPEEDR